MWRPKFISLSVAFSNGRYNIHNGICETLRRYWTSIDYEQSIHDLVEDKKKHRNQQTWRSVVLHVTEPSPSLVKCPTLRGPDHGTLSLRLRATSGFLEARFHCVAGYRLDGSSSSVCVNGLWSDSVPVCIPEEGKIILLAAYILHHSSEWTVIGKSIFRSAGTVYGVS
jgi:hypothetical protein